MGIVHTPAVVKQYLDSFHRQIHGYAARIDTDQCEFYCDLLDDHECKFLIQFTADDGVEIHGFELLTVDDDKPNDFQRMSFCRELQLELDDCGDVYQRVCSVALQQSNETY